jgi:Zn-dependent M28 family amino/carboxypeptidase
MTAAQYSMAATSIPAPTFPISGYVRYRELKALYAKAGIDLTTLVQKASTQEFSPVEVPDAQICVNMTVRETKVVTHNVLARLPGTQRPGETVMYLAHWDHLGRGRPDASGDDIYNGAIDNAAGVAGLLEVARAFARTPRTARSVVFMASTGEELGMQGARWYVDHPIYPLEKTAAVLVMDTATPNGLTRTATVTGYGKTTMDYDQVPLAAAALGRTVLKELEFGGANYNRSDHTMFALKGVPALYLGWGQDRVNPDRPIVDYFARRYHQPSDEWSADLDFSGAAQNIDLLYRVGRALAISSIWPEWKVDGEYKDARRASAGER